MSEAASLSAEELKHALIAAGQHVGRSRDALCELDAIAGDGDLGVTLASGFGHVERALAELDGVDAGTIFKTAGMQLARNAPSTIGALLGSAFLRIGQELDGVTALDADHTAAMLETAARSVAERGGAEPGQRTVLDAMDSAATEARAAASSDPSPLIVLRQGAAGAIAGAAATADMEPRHGRAGWIAERARGQQDAGAVAWAIFLTGLADAASGDTSPAVIASKNVNG